MIRIFIEVVYAVLRGPLYITSAGFNVISLRAIPLFSLASTRKMLAITSLLAALAIAGTALGAPAASSSIAESASATSTASSEASSSIAEPASGTSTASSAASSSSVFYPPGPWIDLDPNEPLWGPDSPVESAVPIRGSLGASILGPDNPAMDLQNADLLATPSTDHGSV